MKHEKVEFQFHRISDLLVNYWFLMKAIKFGWHFITLSLLIMKITLQTTVLALSLKMSLVHK